MLLTEHLRDLESPSLGRVGEQGSCCENCGCTMSSCYPSLGLFSHLPKHPSGTAGPGMTARFSLLREEKECSWETVSRAKPAPLRTQSTFAKGSTARQPCLHPPQHHHSRVSFLPSLPSVTAVACATAQQWCRRERREKGPELRQHLYPHLSAQCFSSWC